MESQTFILCQIAKLPSGCLTSQPITVELPRVISNQGCGGFRPPLEMVPKVCLNMIVNIHTSSLWTLLLRNLYIHVFRVSQRGLGVTFKLCLLNLE